MSRSTLKAIWPGEKVEDFLELSNSWGTAPVVWQRMVEAYLPPKSDWCVWLERTSELWPLWTRQDIPEAHRAMLLFTCDLMYVSRENFPRFAADIRAFLERFPVKEGYANHWPAIAELLDGNPDIPAIGIHCTSVSEDPWTGPYNEERDEHDPIEWSDTAEIYAELDSLSALGKIREG